MRTRTSKREGSLVVYNVEVPNKKSVITGIIVGWGLIVLGVVLEIITAVQFWNAMSSPSYSQYDDYGFGFVGVGEESKPPYVLPWEFGVVALVAGIIVAAILGVKFAKFYEEVEQGEIISRYTSGGSAGLLYGSDLSWMIKIRGNTKANELRTTSYSVNAGKWHDYYKVGDFVDFR